MVETDTSATTVHTAVLYCALPLGAGGAAARESGDGDTGNGAVDGWLVRGDAVVATAAVADALGEAPAPACGVIPLPLASMGPLPWPPEHREALVAGTTIGAAGSSALASMKVTTSPAAMCQSAAHVV